MAKQFTNLSTITEIVNNTEKLRSSGKKGKKHFLLGLEMSWKVDGPGRCAKALPDDMSSTEQSFAPAVLTWFWMAKEEAGGT